jgi:hypothetical protein
LLTYKYNHATNYEYAQIVATLEADFQEHSHMFSCHDCWTQFDHHPGEAKIELLHKAQKLKGCRNDRHKPYVFENLEFHRCPGNFVGSDVKQLLVQFQNYERGVLPFGGSLGEQPAKIVELFNLINGYRSVKIVQKHEEQKREQARKSRGSRRPIGR